MELVYLWVEEYKNIKNQGFNFSPRFTCKYENDTLTIVKKEPEPINIFPDHINITAIVGENGSGKSSLFEILSFYHHVGYLDNKSFILYLKDGQFCIINDKIKKLENNQSSLKKFINFNNKTNLETPEFFSPRGPCEYQTCLFTNDLSDFTNKHIFKPLKEYSHFYNGSKVRTHYTKKISFDLDLDFNLKFFEILKKDTYSTTA